MHVLFLLLLCAVESVIIRLPIDAKHDRLQAALIHDISVQRFINDAKGPAYLAILDDPSRLDSYEEYVPAIFWGDNTCVQVETLSVIEPEGFWKSRVTGLRSAEIKNVHPESEARERAMRLENIISVTPCGTRETHQNLDLGRGNWPLALSQTSTFVQLQDWAMSHSLTGKGQLAMISDTGINYKHMQFGSTQKKPFGAIVGHNFTVKESENPKVVAILVKKGWFGAQAISSKYALQCGYHDLNGHGSHCAGILVGENGAVGLAGNTKLIMLNHVSLNVTPENGLFCGIGGGLSGTNYYDLKSIFDSGLRPSVISNSWGSSTSDPLDYSAENSNFDQFIFENQDTLVLFSAGNGGQNTFSSQTRSKNILSVGSSTDKGTMSFFSSGGPTIDRKGHMTVHVVTNGQNVLSASNTDLFAHVEKSGTSMATPLAAGIAILLREWLLRQPFSTLVSGVSNGTFSQTNKVSGCLLRTLMIHCGQPIKGVHRSAQGFGFLQPSLITDSTYLGLGSYHLRQNWTYFEFMRDTLNETGTLRASVSWYTTQGFFLENVAFLNCTVGAKSYLSNDTLNTFQQLTMKGYKGENVTCGLQLYRSHLNSEGFNVSFVHSFWEGKVVIDPSFFDPPYSGEMENVQLTSNGASEILSESKMYSPNLRLVHFTGRTREAARIACNASFLYIFTTAISMLVLVVAGANFRLVFDQ